MEKKKTTKNNICYCECDTSYMGHAGYIPDICRIHLGYMPDISRIHPGYMQDT